MKKFGQFLKGLSTDENLSTTLTEAYNELDELKQKRITRVSELA